jgi:hypothetical protein
VHFSYRVRHMCRNKGAISSNDVSYQKDHRAFQLSYVRKESIAAPDFISALQLS